MSATVATGLSITNPLVKYRALLATKQLLPDHAQLRLALHLQKLYTELIDYEPQVEYSTRLDQISRLARAGNHVSNDPNRRDNPNSNPNASPHNISSPSTAPRKQVSTWRNLLAAKQKRDTLALTRKLTSHESALQLTSPRGLMLHGEVGTGKSMLIDLFADCLPTRKKRRWHFNTFMLETFAKLEAFRRARTGVGGGGGVDGSVVVAGDGDGEAYSLLWLAKDLVQTSPILFLDEFQMPDRAASKILTNLMTSFFQLGGVLVATSNRMPEELAKAAGTEFAPPPSRLQALGWGFGARRRAGSGGGLFGGQNESAAFLEVLKARCEVWEMRGGRDYRRLESGEVAAPKREDEKEEGNLREVDGHEDLQHSVGMAGRPLADDEASSATAEATPSQDVKPPKFYNVHPDSKDPLPALDAAILLATSTASNPSPWQPSSISVYGRTIPVPRAHAGATLWTFAELCQTTLGPADYITLASTYHTLFLTDVPILTWLRKNEARRFITLLDALYECRCKLFVSAEAGPDDLFFPEKSNGNEDQNADAVYSETLSDIYQDATAPFRPNILSDNPNYAEPDPEPNYTHARFAGMLNADAIEDDPPNKPAQSRSSNPFGRSFGRTDAEMERKPLDPDEKQYAARPDFGKTGSFTGEDEKFAYKRAQSRLWELCGARWWARQEEGWHRPLPKEVRRWERSINQDVLGINSALLGERGEGMGEAVLDETRDERSFRHVSSASPFRTLEEDPPKISWTHIWGTMRWGAKAGAWGKGVEGLKERSGEKGG